MTRNYEMLYWRTNESWYEGDPMNYKKVKLTDEAPERARKSFEMWVEWCKKDG